MRAKIAGILSLALALTLAPWVAPAAHAHDSAPGDPLDAVAFDQRLDAQLPLELRFRDESGAAVRLGDYFGERPVLLILAYYECPNLCPLALDGLAHSLRDLSYAAGQEFEVLALSIDPDETPAVASKRKAELLERYGRPGASEGWHLLTGEHASIDALAEAIGFRYAYDAAQDEYAHPTGVVVLTSGGRIARYLYGIEYPPIDLRLGLTETSQGKIGSPVDRLLLRCYDYNPTTGGYSLAIMRVVRWAGLGTALGLAAFVWAAVRRERATRPASPDESERLAGRGGQMDEG